MKNPNICREIMFCIIIAGLIVASASGMIWGVEPLHPFFILGGIISFSGIIFGMITVRCPVCGRGLRLNGLEKDKFCPYCGAEIK